MVQPLWKTIWWSLKKLKIKLPHDLAIPLLGLYLEKMKTLIGKDTCTQMFTAALFTIAKTWKQSKCPSTNEWIKKMLYTHTHTHTHTHSHTMEYYSAIKNEILPCATTRMDLECIMLSEISETEKDRYCMLSLICEI